MLKQLVCMAKFGGFPVVVHCSDNPGSSTAYFDCLKILESELLPTHPVYLHCFTAGLQVLEAWQKVFPGMYFGFSPKIVWGGGYSSCGVSRREKDFTFKHPVGVRLSIFAQQNCGGATEHSVVCCEHCPENIRNCRANTLTIMKYTARNAKDFYNI